MMKHWAANVTALTVPTDIVLGQTTTRQASTRTQQYAP